MTKDEAIKRLKEEQDDGDIEGAHMNADAILCSLLSSLGYSDVVEEYEKISKWYA